MLLFIVRVMTMADLFYVIGASGSGKDSLIDYARTNMPDNNQVVFTHRYITRSANAGGENHIALAEKEFLLRQAMGCFAMHWYSHNTYYGIGIEIHQWLAKGLNVVVNGSREYLDRAGQKYHELRPILVNVQTEILRNRLETRGRENSEQIEHRLEQAYRLEKTVSHPALVKIENNGELKDAGEQLVHTIQDWKNERCA